MYILSCKDVYKMESDAQNNYNISETILMENAGAALFHFIKNTADKNSKIIILAGPGNNGGDGFVLMRHLAANGYNADLYYPVQNNKYGKAAELNLNILNNLNIHIYDLSTLNNLDKYDIIIDALFGIGLTRSISGIYKEIIEKANNTNALKIAVDIASGLISDSPEVPECVFKADYTITFSTLKYCHTLYPAKTYSGKVITANITIPDNIISQYKHNIFINEYNKPALKNRPQDSHKGTYGKVAVVGGSIEMAGAVKIAASSALHSGCGLITLCHPNTLDRNFISDIPEIMTKSFDYNEAALICDYINNSATVYTIGNGMGRQENVKDFILYILQNTLKPVVIDADAINALSLNELNNIQSEVIMTPHLAEFARLINKDINEIKKDKVSLAKEFADNYSIHLILKSAETIIAVPNDKVYILNTGNTALSKGGSGDALCGLTASLSAQGYSLKDTCILAAYILGKSAEKAVEKNNPAYLSITQIINYYNEVFNEF